MKSSGRIDERGQSEVWVAPPTDLDHPEARLDLVERALTAIERVCSPLAIEVERAGDEPLFLLVEAAQIPAHVAVLSTFAEAPRPLRRALDPDSVRRVLTSTPDWTRLEVLASAARVAPGTDALVLAQLPSRTLPVTTEGGALRVAGPVDADGWRRVPPIAVRIDDEAGVVRVRLTAHWSPWLTVGTPERGYLEQARNELARAGFTRDDEG